MTPPDYVRTKGGQVVHRGTCPVLKRVKYAHEWRWAKGKTPQQIRVETSPHGLVYDWCRVCFK